MTAPTGVVWLLVGVDAKHAERQTRKALTALRRDGFTANTASPEAVLAKAAELTAHLEAQAQLSRKAVIER